jgi:hypothetical protein
MLPLPSLLNGLLCAAGGGKWKSRMGQRSLSITQHLQPYPPEVPCARQAPLSLSPVSYPSNIAPAILISMTRIRTNQLIRHLFDLQLQ